MDTWDPDIVTAQMRAIEAQAAIEYARKTRAALTWDPTIQEAQMRAVQGALDAAIQRALEHLVPEPEHCPEDKARFFNAARDVARGQ